MKWMTKTVSHECLENELNSLSERGLNIYQILPVGATHVCIVSDGLFLPKDPQPEQDDKYYGAKPKKGKKS